MCVDTHVEVREGRARGRAGQGRLVLQAALAVLLCASLFALLELGLRVAGIGADRRSTMLAYQEVYPPALVPGTRPDGVATWRTWDPRLPFQSVPRQKAPDTLRVFVLGGSASAGLGFSPNVTFGRHLEQLLERGHPERTIELVNLGIVAISSTQVRLLVEDVLARYEPDLLIVYSGNNEFLELHARKYAEIREGPAARVRGWIMSTNLQRALREALVGPARPAAPPLRDPAQDERERLTEARIVREVQSTPAEIEAVLGTYAANLEAMARAASAAEVPLILCGVAANREWRGREDLPADWIRSLPGGPRTREQALAVLAEVLAREELGALERWEALFQRATLLRELGDVEGAREGFRAAHEQDPHLRRALARQSELARDVAARTGALYLDTLALFESTAEDGIIGFEHFYDYVHFTPRGAAELGAALHGVIGDLESLPRGVELELEGYALEHAAEVAALDQDFLDSRHFLGIAFDPARLSDRDLWKYDYMLRDLDARLLQDPDDALALIFRANARSFRQDGAAAAAKDYRRAMELVGETVELRANLDRLLAERQAGAAPPKR